MDIDAAYCPKFWEAKAEVYSLRPRPENPLLQLKSERSYNHWNKDPPGGNDNLYPP